MGKVVLGFAAVFIVVFTLVWWNNNRWLCDDLCVQTQQQARHDRLLLEGRSPPALTGGRILNQASITDPHYGRPGAGYIAGSPQTPAQCLARGGHVAGRGCADFN